MNAKPRLLLDAHVHLQDESFGDDLDEVLCRAAEAGVRYLLCNGSSEEDWPSVLDLSQRYPAIIPSLGLHPWYMAQRSDRWLATLENLVRSVPCGVGEIGLDHWQTPRDDAAQEEVFAAQLNLARHLKRPATIHCLRAWGRLIEILDSQPPLPAGFLLHAYSGPAELIERLVERNAWFSFSANILHENHKRVRQTIACVPADRLMLESDAPFMPPPQDRCPDSFRRSGENIRNEPAILPLVLAEAARLRSQPPEELAAALSDNARRFLSVLIER